MIRVSVVIPAYQAAGHIARAVRSALDQTLGELEVIVVDDGSSDATAEIARTAGGTDERLHVIERPHNEGVSAARNAALSVARGTWIALLDADDGIAPERLARMVAGAEASRADLFADGVLLERAGHEAERLFDIPQRYEGAAMDARAFVTLDSPTRPLGFMKPLMRRAFLEAHALRYPAEIDIGEDFHFYVQCLLRGARLIWSNATAYTATARSGSLSRSGSERAVAAFARTTHLLRDEALALGQHRVARALVRRSSDLTSYGTYDRLSEALHRRRLLEAGRIFASLALKSYTWRRFATAAGRRLAPRSSKPQWR